MELLHNPQCFMNHMGVWSVEPSAGQGYWESIQAGLRSASDDNLNASIETQDIQGIRVIPIVGMMQKGRSKYGGVSTLDVRREISKANRDDSIKGIMLMIDSPGGHTSGTQALADEIQGSAKPIRAHVDDLAASAALWIAAVTDHISADKTSTIGSIGTFAVLQDTSGLQEQSGIKLHLVSTGPLKGAGADGVVDDALIAEVQERVDSVNEFFLESMVQGRGMSRADIDALATGAVFSAKESLSNGLIDQITDAESSLLSFIESTQRSQSNSAKARISIAKRR